MAVDDLFPDHLFSVLPRLVLIDPERSARGGQENRRVSPVGLEPMVRVNLAVKAIRLGHRLSVLLELIRKVLFVEKDIIIPRPMVEPVFHLSHRVQEREQVRVACFRSTVAR